MKDNLKFLIMSLAALLFISSCDKDGNAIDDEKIQTERIEDIIPKQYLDTLAKLNFKINKGVKPPILKGRYAIQPHKLDTSNIASDVPGYVFSDAIVSLYGQNNEDFSIKLLGENFLNLRDTSISTAISGSGNDFTIYGKVKSNNGQAYAITAILISGTLEGENLKNLQTGIIMIDDSHGAGVFIKNGQARVAFDSDFISEKIGDAENQARHREAGTISKSKLSTLSQRIESY